MDQLLDYIENDDSWYGIVLTSRRDLDDAVKSSINFKYKKILQDRAQIQDSMKNDDRYELVKAAFTIIRKFYI